MWPTNNWLFSKATRVERNNVAKHTLKWFSFRASQVPHMHIKCGVLAKHRHSHVTLRYHLALHRCSNCSSCTLASHGPCLMKLKWVTCVLAYSTHWKKAQLWFVLCKEAYATLIFVLLFCNLCPLPMKHFHGSTFSCSFRFTAALIKSDTVSQRPNHLVDILNNAVITKQHHKKVVMGRKEALLNLCCLSLLSPAATPT